MRLTLDRQTGFRVRNADLFLPILVLMSLSAPQSFAITLPKYVNESTSSRMSPSNTIPSSIVLFMRMTLVLSLLTFSPSLADVLAKPVVWFSAAFADACTTLVRYHPQSPGHPVGTKVSIEGQGCVLPSFCALSNLLPLGTTKVRAGSLV